MTPVQDYPHQPVDFTQVQIRDAFWDPRLATNRQVTIPYALAQCEATGRIDNFARAAGWLDGPFEGKFYNDSDLFKVIEGAAYALALHPDPALDADLDDLIAKIAAAQEPDGYLYTARTIDPENVPDRVGETRWSNPRVDHELYNVGHLYEAAAAHYTATGKRSLLDVAVKNADLVDRVFGPGKLAAVPGHQEIEIGLVKLYRVTGERRYLQLSTFFLDQRGNAQGHDLYGPYAQDHQPVTAQQEAVGHAVRAGYLYTGMADVAALTGDAGYVAAIDRLWENVVGKKQALTGGVGARHQGEAFGDAYELPNATAYNETCAAIANLFWNHRLFLLHGHGKYIDVLERVLYNGFLSGVSLAGNTFFYTNPLASDGATRSGRRGVTRQPWFGTACCPTNVTRVMPSLGGYIYAQRDGDCYVNLYVGGQAALQLGDAPVTVTQETGYPWTGQVTLTLGLEAPAAFTLRLRIPGWAQGRPVPSDLYGYLPLADAPSPSLRINGRPGELALEDGYAALSRTWADGDRVSLTLPMPVQRVVSHPKVAANVDQVALERGPLVYCAEWPDNDAPIPALAVPDDVAFQAEHRHGLLGGVTVLIGQAYDTEADAFAPLTLIPYYAWAHRGPGQMAVWLQREAR